MKSSAEPHIARAHIVLEKPPPSAEVVRERDPAWVLHRRRCVLQWVCSEPLRIRDRLVDGGKPCDFGESGRQVSPCKVVRRYLDILTSSLIWVVENVAGEISEV